MSVMIILLTHLNQREKLLIPANICHSSYLRCLSGVW